MVVYTLPLQFAHPSLSPLSSLHDIVCILKANNTDLVTLDTGAFYYGNGLLYSTFGGAASSVLMANAQYDAVGLAYRDFTADHNGDGGYSPRTHARTHTLAPFLFCLQCFFQT